jgi:hypothetical protein
VPVVNAVLKVISLAFMAFTVWMFVDVLRRRMNRKVIWVLLTLIHAGISLVIGPSQFNIKFNFKIAIGLSGITAYNSSLAVATSVLLPVGAIIYFFVRKKLTAQFDAENQAETQNGQQNPEEEQTSVSECAIAPAENKPEQEETKEENNNNNNNNIQQGE